MPLSDKEVLLVRQALSETTDFRVFPLLVETILWSIFTVLMISASYIMVCRGLDVRAKRVMLSFTLVMYTLATLDWLIDVRRVWTDLKTSVPALLVSPALDESALNTTNTVLRIVQASTNNLCVIFGDLVVSWRVCVVYNWSRSTVITAIFLMLALFSTALTCNLTQIGVGFPGVKPLHALQPSQLYIDIIALSFSAIINIWATGMIAFKVWLSRNKIKHYLSNSDRKASAESVMTIFVESGVVYTTLWILKNIIIIPGVANTPYTNYAIFIMNQAVGMYPTVILVLVALQKSHLESRFTYSGSIVTSGSVQFAHGSDTTVSVTISHQVSSVADRGNTFLGDNGEMVTDMNRSQASTTAEKPYKFVSEQGSYESFSTKQKSFAV